MASTDLPDVLQGEIVIGRVGGVTRRVKPTISLTHGATAYAAGDAFGDAYITLTKAVRLPGGTAIWQSLLIVDTYNQRPAMDVILFSSALTGTYHDNSAVNFSAADMAAILRKQSVTAGDWTTIGGATSPALSIVDLRQLGGTVQAASGSVDLYAAIVCNSTPTYQDASTTNLQVTFGFLDD